MDRLTNRSAASIEQSDMKMHLFALPNLDNKKKQIFCHTLSVKVTDLKEPRV